MGMINTTWTDLFCQNYDNLSCNYSGHEEKGHEEVTLQRLHEFCNHNPNNLVAYLHTKGTFHANEANHNWRRLLTQAALKDSCFQSLLEGKCNVCGLQCYPIWITILSGNFFAAHCSYVRQLLPVPEHAAKMDNVIESVKAGLRRNNKIWSLGAFKCYDDMLGTGRYSKETWIGSHPNLRPCDLAGNITEVFYKVPEPVGMEYIENGLTQAAPRVPPDQGNWFRLKMRALRKLMNSPNDLLSRPHEYFLLPGQLYRYFRLYGQYPPWDSWVWQWYPHGLQLREKVQEVMKREQIAGGNKVLNESLLW